MTTSGAARVQQPSAKTLLAKSLCVAAAQLAHLRGVLTAGYPVDRKVFLKDDKARRAGQRRPVHSEFRDAISRE
jgi:hypothetical protein